MEQQLKVLPTSRKVVSADGDSLGPIGEVHLKFKIGNIVFHERFMILNNLQCDIILWLPWQWNYRIRCTWNQEGKHPITIKNHFLALSIAPYILRQLVKTKAQCTLQHRLIMWISIQTPWSLDTNSLFKINLDRQLPKGIIPLDVLHSINHKQPQVLIMPILNIANTDIKLLKNTVLGSLTRVNSIDSIHNVSWTKMKPTSNKTQGTTLQKPQVQTLLPVFLEQSCFQIHAHDDNKPSVKLQGAVIPWLVQNKLNEMLNNEFTCIVSKSPADFSRTNLVEMDLPTTGLPICIRTLHHISETQVFCGWQN